MARQAQRTRIVSAMTEIVCREGIDSATVARVTVAARVSRGTFYDLFSDRNECLLAVFDTTLARVTVPVRRAFQAGGDWLDGVRAAMLELLLFLEADRQLARFLLVQSLAGDPALLARRARVLAELAVALETGREESPWAAELPSMTAEGVIGAILSILYGRLLEPEGDPLTGLWGCLMSVIALPYRGPAAARSELALMPPPGVRQTPRAAGRRHDLLDRFQLRVTYRTMRVLAAIAEHPGISNAQVADGAGIRNAGQVSKLLGRLSRLGLIVNTREGEPKFAQKAWRLTPDGASAHEALRDLLPGT